MKNKNSKLIKFLNNLFAFKLVIDYTNLKKNLILLKINFRGDQNFTKNFL